MIDPNTQLPIGCRWTLWARFTVNAAIPFQIVATRLLWFSDWLLESGAESVAKTYQPEDK